MNLIKSNAGLPMKNTKLVVSASGIEDYSGDILVRLVTLDEKDCYMESDISRSSSH